jgi:hypothetical protein
MIKNLLAGQTASHIRVLFNIEGGQHSDPRVEPYDEEASELYNLAVEIALSNFEQEDKAKESEVGEDKDDE